jgi:hypothetical protein
MPISKRKEAPPTPQVRFFVAEDLREEVGGKISAIGLYPDNVIIVSMPPDSPEPSAEKPAAIRSLSFLFNISGLVSSSKVSIEIQGDGRRQPFMKPQELHPPQQGISSFNLIGISSPFLLASFGTKKFIVSVGDTAHTFEVEIRKMAAPPITVQPRVASGKPDAPLKTSPKRTRKPAEA